MALSWHAPHDTGAAQRYRDGLSGMLGIGECGADVTAAKFRAAFLEAFGVTFDGALASTKDWRKAWETVRDRKAAVEQPRTDTKKEVVMSILKVKARRTATIVRDEEAEMDVRLVPTAAFLAESPENRAEIERQSLAFEARDLHMGRDGDLFLSTNAGWAKWFTVKVVKEGEWLPDGSEVNTTSTSYYPRAEAA